MDFYFHIYNAISRILLLASADILLKTPIRHRAADNIQTHTQITTQTLHQLKIHLHVFNSVQMNWFDKNNGSFIEWNTHLIRSDKYYLWKSSSGQPYLRRCTLIVFLVFCWNCNPHQYLRTPFAVVRWQEQRTTMS